MTLGGCHMSVVKAICKELPPLLQTLSQLYETSVDTEAYGIHSIWLLLMVYQAVITYQKLSVPLLSLNLFMQKKIANFSKLPIMLKSKLII